jgi:hypothetical protein
VHAKYEADFLADLGKPGKAVAFIVEEMALVADDAARLQTALSTSPHPGAKSRSDILSASWKDAVAGGAAMTTQSTFFGALDAPPGASAGAAAGGGDGATAAAAAAAAAADEAASGGYATANFGATGYDGDFTVPAALSAGRRAEEPMLSSGSYPPSIPPPAERDGFSAAEPAAAPRFGVSSSGDARGGGGGGGGAAVGGGGGGGASAASAAAFERELAALRAQYNVLTRDVLVVSAERDGLSAAAVKRERDYEELRAQYARELARADAGAKAAPDSALRQRGGAGGVAGGGGAAAAGAAPAAAAADDEDDSTARDAGDAGFALWQLLLCALIAFLAGRLSNAR